MCECRTAVGTSEALQRVRTQVSGVDSIRAAHTNVGLQQVPTRFCNTQMQDSDVDGIQAARRNIGQQWVATKHCNAYERRSTM